MSAADHIDDILSAVGCGWWQIYIFMSMFISTLIPVHEIASTLLCAPVPFRCFLPDSNNILQPTNQSEVGFWETVFEDPDERSLWYNSQCLDLGALPNRSMEDFVSSSELVFSNRHKTGLQSCPEIEYNNSIFSSTVITEFHLVCERLSLRLLFQLMMTLGSVTGCVLGGLLGDIFGRKRAVQISALIGIPASIGVAFMTSYPVILIHRFFVGVAFRTAVLPNASNAMETCPPNYRALMGTLMGIPYSVSIILFGCCGYVIRDWRYLQLVCSLPFILLLPLSFLLDESPRWLVQQGRGEEAANILESVARRSLSHIPDNVHFAIEKIRKQISINEGSSPTTATGNQGSSNLLQKLQEFHEYMSCYAMRVILILTPVLTILLTLLTIGINLNVNNFTSTDPFTFLVLLGFVGILSLIIAAPLNQRLGRKLSIGGSTFLSALFLMLDLAIHPDYWWAKWLVVLISFSLAYEANQIVFMYASELYPTTIRARGFAFSNFMGSVGLCFAPLITDLLIEEAWWGVHVTLGMTGVLSSVLIPFLPETNNIPLPQTLEDVRNRHKRWKKEPTAMTNEEKENDENKERSKAELRYPQTIKILDNVYPSIV